MKLTQTLLLILLLSTALLFSCKDSKTNDVPDPDNPPLDLSIPQGFDYSTTRDLTLNITASEIEANRTIAQIYNGDPLGGGRLIDQVIVLSGQTVSLDLNLPTYKNDLWVMSTLPSGVFSLQVVELNGSVNQVNLITKVDDSEGLSNRNVDFSSYSQLSAGLLSTENPVIQDFESGDRNIESAKCWIFQASTIATNNAINGTFSMRTGPMTSPINPQVLTSPWVDLDGSGTLDFKHLITSFNGFKEVTVLLLDNSGNANPPQVLYYFEYSSSSPLQDVSIPITASGIHRIAWVFRGTGGNSRGILDDISIPGTYASDPANGCVPLTPTSEPTEVINYYPAEDVFGSLAYEDLWPNFGDYDMNDLVVDYNIEITSNGDNLITQLKYTNVIRAMGAGLDSGFGVQFPVAPARVSSVSGQRLTTGSISISANGTEAAQDLAVVMFWDDSAENIGKFANTDPNQNPVTPDTVVTTITFNPPVSRADLGNAPWNPFIFVEGNRGLEIHLPNKAPTSLADVSIFGTFNDDTTPASEKFYLSATNLNWAINIPESFVYPREIIKITDAYPRFKEWAESGGEAFPDWYRDLAGNRVNSLLYIVNE